MPPTSGRPYLKLSEARQGLIELDSGFTCRRAGPVMLFKDERGLYFHCDDGTHYLDGQADDGEHCVGVYSCESCGGS
jgi:hypothetical protein